MKAIVHIGREKTGTSSLQSYLYLNRQQLKNAGFHFIQSAGQLNNWMLPAFCSNDAAFNDLFKENESLALYEATKNKEIPVSTIAQEMNKLRNNQDR